LLAKSYVAQLVIRGWFKLTATRPVVNPDPTGAIIRDLQKYVAAKGATLVVGLTRSNPPLEEFLRYLRLPYVDLSTPLRYPNFGGHWTPEGHTFVCNKIDEFFAAGKFMESSEKTTAAAVQTVPSH
ncbi:MAG TPA: hypothetical protein VFE51_04125, partial [Verrucomicrobiae bacterium]|nr:hypothetical protein [Verrucomicrobiae bacterium]